MPKSINWIEQEHINEATARVMETCLWHPEEIADGSVKFDLLAQSLLRIFGSGKSRLETGDLLFAAIDDYLHDRIQEEAENVLDEEREAEYINDFNKWGY